MIDFIQKPWENGLLSVADNKRGLCNGKKAFFWLGDTAWLMLKKLTKDKIHLYLENRKRKGYNVIQIMGIHILPHTNAYGRAPFLFGDISLPDTEGDNNYWQILDYAIDTMERMGLYAAIVPIWGTNLENGTMNAESAEAYMNFLATRYKNRPNIIWLNGGDILGNIGYEIWDKLGEILKEKCPNHLVTFHPFGATSSSQWFHNKDWLDFNMFQSGHSTYEQVEQHKEEFIEKERALFAEDNWKYAKKDLALTPQKPTIDGEPSYERITKGLKKKGTDFWDAPAIRRYAYWSVFSGCFGFTYGHSAVMQFYSDNGGEGKAYNTQETWLEALHHPAANQMPYLRSLMATVDYQDAVVLPDLLENNTAGGHQYIPVLVGNGYVFSYNFTGRAMKYSQKILNVFKEEVFAEWFCPVSGIYSFIGRYSIGSLPEFLPPKRFDGSSDWVLIIKNA